VTPTRVTRVITRLNIGGPARQALILTDAMEARGFESELVWGSVGPAEGQFDPPASMRNFHIEELRRQTRPVDDIRALLALRSRMRTRQPLVVHTHMAKAGALGRIAARQAGVPVVVHTFHGHVIEGYFSGPVSRAIVETERRLARWTDALIAVSPAVRDDLLGLGVGRSEQWRVIPLGLDLDPLLSSKIEQTEARIRLGLPREGPMVGIVGRLVPIKDHATFISAMERVASERPDIQVVVAGDGELRKELEAQAQRVLGSRLHFLGWVTDLPNLYAALDVVVLTSRNEGTPVALIEAGAAGKPTVATHVGGVADVIDHGDTGLLAPVGDTEMLARHILTIIRGGERANCMGLRARARVAGRFSGERLVRDVADLYRDLLSRRTL
jgi:glycosyltransferase involved in cell wall biosynthesis